MAESCFQNTCQNSGAITFIFIMITILNPLSDASLTPARYRPSEPSSTTITSQSKETLFSILPKEIKVSPMHSVHKHWNNYCQSLHFLHEVPLSIVGNMCQIMRLCRRFAYRSCSHLRMRSIFRPFSPNDMIIIIYPAHYRHPVTRVPAKKTYPKLRRIFR